MSASPAGRSLRSTLLALTAAILGVLVLDATALVAAPTKVTPDPSSILAPVHSNVGLRLLKWSGEIWMVSPGSANGPDGPHTLSDSTSAASVDGKGRLHLHLTRVNGEWRGVQLEALRPLNYGTYRFVTHSAVGNLAKPGVLGMFVFEPSKAKYTNEIDLEDSRGLGGLGYPRDAQYVVQPYYKKHHIHRYAIRRKFAAVTHQFTWRPGKVSFLTHAGAGRHGKRLGHFRFAGYDVPQPGNEHIYINLHLHPNRPPGKGSRGVVLKEFSYAPLK